MHSGRINFRMGKFQLGELPSLCYLTLHLTNLTPRHNTARSHKSLISRLSLNQLLRSLLLLAPVPTRLTLSTCTISFDVIAMLFPLMSLPLLAVFLPSMQAQETTTTNCTTYRSLDSFTVPTTATVYDSTVSSTSSLPYDSYSLSIQVRYPSGLVSPKPSGILTQKLI